MIQTDIILVVLGQMHVNILAMLSLPGGGWGAGARGEGGVGREDWEAAAERQDGGENTICWTGARRNVLSVSTLTSRRDEASLRHMWEDWKTATERQEGVEKKIRSLERFSFEQNMVGLTFENGK